MEMAFLPVFGAETFLGRGMAAFCLSLVAAACLAQATRPGPAGGSVWGGAESLGLVESFPVFGLVVLK